MIFRDVLLVTLILLAVGFALMYAGVHGGENWKRPWAPFVDAFSPH